MTTETERPTFTHKRARHGLIGPFSGRQLLAGAIAVLVVAIIGVAVTTPLGNTANAPDLVDPLATPFIIGDEPAQGLQAGDDGTRAHDRPRRRHDLPARRTSTASRSPSPLSAARSCG